MSAAGTGRPERRRVLGSGRRLAVMGAVAAFTVLLAQHTTTAAFTAQTGDTADTVTTSTTICTTPGPKLAIADADATGYQGTPSTPYPSETTVAVTSGSGGNARVLVRFPFPPLNGCSVTAASLKMWVTSGQTGRIIDVYRVDPAAAVWTEAGLTWNTLPPTTGDPIGSNSITAGAFQTWDVVGMMPALYAGVNNGFLLRDSMDTPTRTQYWDSRDSLTPGHTPRLELTPCALPSRPPHVVRWEDT